MHWLLHTDAGLLTRISAGCAIFAVLAALDLHRHGKAATRWREYTVLLAAVAAALLYGVINDQVTVTISSEYFIFGKEIYKMVGENPPAAQLRWEATKVGLKATWTVGLIFGVMLLLVNNPYRNLPRLTNLKLLWHVPLILCFAAAFGAVGGWLGYHGFLTRLDSDFGDMVDANIFRPQRFMCTWGIHLGGYVGGVVGAIVAIAGVIRSRIMLKRIAPMSIDPAGI